ncbi:MAG TPA: NAD(+)/NADH kinase [Dehalococcoidia bacterium]|nr:NAD(+)/NADH kinase [Dehalococcoidia bacterium]
MLKQVTVFHQGNNESALSLAGQAERELQRAGVATIVDDVWGDAAPEQAAGVDLIVCIGGDGTVLRAARVALPSSAPLLGVNMGRLGFLTQLSPRDFFNRFERILAHDWRVEERIMVRSEVAEPDGTVRGPFHALNDVVASRKAPGRPVYVDVRIDGAKVANYRCDGMIVATPTGSTGYSLSAGGPILDPTEHHLVLTPVAAHLALGRAIVLGSESTVDLVVTSDDAVILSVDGQEVVPVYGSAHVTVRVSEHIARFATFREPASFFSELAERFEIQLSSAMSSRA